MTVRLMEDLRLISEIPHEYQHIFSQYNNFNVIQSKVFDDVFNSDKSLVLSAPTGSGKTVVFELAIIRLLMHTKALSESGHFKIVYVAPIKALCTERAADWVGKFDGLGIQCVEITGDSEVYDFGEFDSAQLIVTTPEKWDSLTRRWRDNRTAVSAIKLFMIDEVHLLNEDVRGPILETIVSRMKTIQFSTAKGSNSQRQCMINLRFLAVSATIPNIEDLAEWLKDKNPLTYYQISDTYRPVKLKRFVLGFNSNQSGFKFDMHLNYKLAQVIRKYSNGKPTLIFCSSRKAVEMASSVLVKEKGLLLLGNTQKAALVKISQNLQDTKLQNLMIKGIAYHHAGLSYNDRNIIEESFRNSIIMILISTNTLAMGVNLPAHLVVVKSTESFIHGTVVEYSESAILQMIGRAGRPQYDCSGVAVIMTQQKNVKKYENLMDGCTPIESHLHKHLAEHLNSEIVLQTITDLEVAMEWIRSTFLYVRAVKCPVNYGFAHGMTRDRVEKKLEEICLIQINALEANNLLIKDQTFGLTLRSTEYGRLMARYYISFETIKQFGKIRGDECLLEVLMIIVHAKEFSEFTLRVSDKRILNEINNKPIRFPIRGKIKSVQCKISCLMQSVLDNITITEPSLIQDSLKIVRLGERVSKCFSEYVQLSEKNFNGKIFKALLNSIIIAKSLKCKLWENSSFVSKQLKKIGTVYSSTLVNSGKTTLKSLLETEPSTLEMILNKAPPFGREIHQAIASFPDYSLDMQIINDEFVEIIVKQNNQKYKKNINTMKANFIVGDTDNTVLFFSEKIDTILLENGIFRQKFKIRNPKTSKISAHLIHLNLVGVDKMVEITLNFYDNEFADSKLPKKKLQTKLQIEHFKKDTTNFNSYKKGNTIESKNEYVSLLEDDFDFDEILSSISKKEVDSKNQLMLSTKENNLYGKCKLQNFEYKENKKLPILNTKMKNGILDNILEKDFVQNNTNKIDMIKKRNSISENTKECDQLSIVDLTITDGNNESISVIENPDFVKLSCHTNINKINSVQKFFEINSNNRKVNNLEFNCNENFCAHKNKDEISNINNFSEIEEPINLTVHNRKNSTEKLVIFNDDTPLDLTKNSKRHEKGNFTKPVSSLETIKVIANIPDKFNESLLSKRTSIFNLNKYSSLQFTRTEEKIRESSDFDKLPCSYPLELERTNFNKFANKTNHQSSAKQPLFVSKRASSVSLEKSLRQESQNVTTFLSPKKEKIPKIVATPKSSISCTYTRQDKTNSFSRIYDFPIKEISKVDKFESESGIFTDESISAYDQISTFSINKSTEPERLQDERRALNSGWMDALSKDNPFSGSPSDVLFFKKLEVFLKETENEEVINSASEDNAVRELQSKANHRKRNANKEVLSWHTKPSVEYSGLRTLKEKMSNPYRIDISPRQANTIKCDATYPKDGDSVSGKISQFRHTTTSGISEDEYISGLVSTPRTQLRRKSQMDCLINQPALRDQMNTDLLISQSRRSVGDGNVRSGVNEFFIDLGKGSSPEHPHFFKHEMINTDLIINNSQKSKDFENDFSENFLKDESVFQSAIEENTIQVD